MNIKHGLALSIISAGIILSSAGCAVIEYSAASPPAASTAISVLPSYPAVIVPSDVTVSFDRSEVVTAPAPVKAPIRKTSEKPAAVKEEPKAEPPARNTVIIAKPAPVAAAPVVKVPVTETVKTPVKAPVAPAAPDRVVYVGIAGDQTVVDQGNGPVLFPLPAGWPPYVAEHDYQGGWARFGSLVPGMKVRMTGLVTGDYTVGQIINVPKGGTTDEFRAFTKMPKVFLQTCIPGTDRMIVVGLY